jgi:hypothetical protein
MHLELYPKSPEGGLWRALQCRLITVEIIGVSMPVLHASSLAISVVGSLKARNGYAHHASKKLIGTHIPIAGRSVKRQLPNATP